MCCLVMHLGREAEKPNRRLQLSSGEAEQGLQAASLGLEFGAAKVLGQDSGEKEIVYLL